MKLQFVQKSSNADSNNNDGYIRKNLIENPCGDEGFKHWKYIRSSDINNFDNFKKHLGIDEYTNESAEDEDNYQTNYSYLVLEPKDSDDGFWGIETEQNGSQPLLDNDGNKCKNFVTSYNLCSKFQIIDLESKDLLEDLKRYPKCRIEISESYAPRWDCGSMYRIIVWLLDEDFKVLDEFKYDEMFEDGVDNWHHVKHSFNKLPPSLKYVIYYHQGIDRKFWSGHYGIKITNSSVKVLPE